MIDSIKSIGINPANTTGADIEMTPVRQPSSVADTQGSDFGELLGGLFTSTANTVKHAEAVSIAGIKGKATVQQVVEAVMNAEQSLQGAIAVRDKVVTAYLEISRMQI